MEYLCDIRIHLDHDVLLVGDLGVAGVHLALHPLVEDLAQDRGNDVAGPRLRRLRQLKLGIGKILEYVRMIVSQELEYVFNR